MFVNSLKKGSTNHSFITRYPKFQSSTSWNVCNFSKQIVQRSKYLHFPASLLATLSSSVVLHKMFVASPKDGPNLRSVCSLIISYIEFHSGTPFVTLRLHFADWPWRGINDDTIFVNFQMHVLYHILMRLSNRCANFVTSLHGSTFPWWRHVEDFGLVSYEKI